jgi:peroxiredoxin
MVGEKAPDFTLPDKDGKPVKISDLLAAAGPGGQKGSWVLLIFYRGYW